MIRELPGAPKPEQFRLFEYLLELNPQCQPQVNQHYFTAIERDLRRTRSKADHDAVRTASSIIVRAEADKMVREIILLNLLMPNGKPMRDCTGMEMGGFGRAYTKIAEKVGPDRRVGDVISEEQVRKLVQKGKQ